MNRKRGAKWDSNSQRMRNDHFWEYGNESLIPQIRKMVFFDALVENKGEVKENGLTSYKQKEVRKTEMIRADIVVKPANEGRRQREGVRSVMVEDTGQTTSSGRKEDGGEAT